MWFGSYNGLHKHEGTSIKVYNRSGKDSASLSSKEMHAVFEDRLGFIWAGTTGGLDKLDPRTGIITHVKLLSAKRPDGWIGYILCIFQDDKDNILVKYFDSFTVKHAKFIKLISPHKTARIYAR